MTITQEQVLNRMQEVEDFLKANLTQIVTGNWRLDGYSVDPEETPYAAYDLVARLTLSDTTAKTPFHDAQAFGIGGTDAIVDWLLEAGVIDGTVDVRINEVEDAAEPEDTEAEAPANA